MFYSEHKTRMINGSEVSIIQLEIQDNNVKDCNGTSMGRYPIARKLC